MAAANDSACRHRRGVLGGADSHVRGSPNVPVVAFESVRAAQSRGRSSAPRRSSAVRTNAHPGSMMPRVTPAGSPRVGGFHRICCHRRCESPPCGLHRDHRTEGRPHPLGTLSRPTGEGWGEGRFTEVTSTNPRQLLAAQQVSTRVAPSTPSTSPGQPGRRPRPDLTAPAPSVRARARRAPGRRALQPQTPPDGLRSPPERIQAQIRTPHAQVRPPHQRLVHADLDTSGRCNLFSAAASPPRVRSRRQCTVAPLEQGAH
jgi:hypothetical protein